MVNTPSATPRVGAFRLGYRTSVLGIVRVDARIAQAGPEHDRVVDGHRPWRDWIRTRHGITSTSIVGVLRPVASVTWLRRKAIRRRAQYP